MVVEVELLVKKELEVEYLVHYNSLTPPISKVFLFPIQFRYFEIVKT